MKPTIHDYIEAASRLSYDPATGLLAWTGNYSPRARAGQVAGCIFNNGYRVLSVNGANLLAHRVAWFMSYGNLPECIDHRNGDRADNRIENLRACSMSENQYNRRVSRVNRTGVSGVYFSARCNRWIAQIRANKQHRYLGCFLTIDRAIAARRRAEEELHGDFCARRGVQAGIHWSQHGR